MSLIPDVLVDSFVITMVAYTISMSMALIFAQQVGYEVDSNQELVAQVNHRGHAAACTTAPSNRGGEGGGLTSNGH